MRASLGALVFVLACGPLISCSDPWHFDNEKAATAESEACAADPAWLEDSRGTPALAMFDPLPHPATECPFYRAGFQEFLVAMQPDANGRPAIVSYPTIDTVFTPKVALGARRAFLGGIKQAGGRQIAIDQNGNTLFYGIHVNPAYADFIHASHLETADAIRAYPSAQPQLYFPPGVAEFKTAWQVVEGDVAALTKGFIWMNTTVPTLHQDPSTHQITEDMNAPRQVTVRLLAVHVVFTLPGHPEFVWASFEHSDGTPDVQAADDRRDVAPIAPGDANPADDDPNNAKNTAIVSAHDFILYKAGTPANLGNHPIDDADLQLVGQKFPGQQTSIYRMFPASKSNQTDPDDQISSLNHNVEALFERDRAIVGPNDNRGHYRLVGAQWLDKPEFFKTNMAIQNDKTSPLLSDHYENGKLVKAVSLDALAASIVQDGTDSPLSIVAGEDRLSSTAMESFTQGPDSFNNCFTCHDTQAITIRGVPLDRDAGGTKLLDPGMLNVSHVLTEFLARESQAGH